MSGRDGDREPLDSGTTMIELAVSLVVMSIAMTIFTTGILAVYRTVNKTESLATAQRQITTAFQRMDRDLRYASAISMPGLVGGDNYVEYLMYLAGQDTCVELKLASSTSSLQRRTWVNNMPVYGAGSTGWTVLVAPVQATAPFTFIAPDGVSTYFQALQVQLSATVGTGPTATTRTTDVTFAALNTTMGVPTPTVCSAGRSTP